MYVAMLATNCLAFLTVLQKAQNALHQQAEIEKTQSWISSFVNDVGLTLEESDMSFVADYNEYEYHTEMWLQTHTVE